MATRRSRAIEGPGPRAAVAPIRRGNRCAAKMAAPAPLNLLAPGAAGWAMPRLDGVAASHKVWPGDRVAAVIGSGLLLSGVAQADTWELAEKNPFQFIGLSIKRFVDQHGSALISEGFRVNLTLTGTLNEYATGDREIDAANLFLTIDPVESGYLVLGSTIRMLEEQHPRLPATFFHLLCGALNRWVRVYDYRDALEHVERLLDWYTADPDSGSVEVPDVEGSIPAAIRRKPLSPKGLKRLLPMIAGDARVWMESAAALAQVANREVRPRITEEIGDQLDDCNPPLPSLLVVFSRRDSIEACFDAEAESMMEVSPEPGLVIPLDAANPDRIRRAFDVLGVACETLAMASKLMALLPDSSFK